MTLTRFLVLLGSLSALGLFKDIQLEEGAGTSLLRGSAEGVSFERVRVKGQPAASTSDVQLKLEGDVKHLGFTRD